MKREISGTSVATAVLLFAAAILLCTKLESIAATDIRLAPAVALPLEGLFYAGLLYIWSGRLSLRAQGLGLPSLFALRMGICGAAAGAAHLAGASSPGATQAVWSPSSLIWSTAVGFAVVAVYLLREMVLPASRGYTGHGTAVAVAASSPTPSEVIFELHPTPTDASRAASSVAAAVHGDEDVFQVIDPRPLAEHIQLNMIPPSPPVEGWVTLPASALRERLPAGVEVVGEQVEVPLALIVPRLREGQVRISVAELDGLASVAPGAAGEEDAIELPLEVVVPQLPDEVLEPPKCTPPAWLAVDAELEDIFFAKV